METSKVYRVEYFSYACIVIDPNNSVCDLTILDFDFEGQNKAKYWAAEWSRMHNILTIEDFKKKHIVPPVTEWENQNEF